MQGRSCCWCQRQDLPCTEFTYIRKEKGSFHLHFRLVWALTRSCSCVELFRWWHLPDAGLNHMRYQTASLFACVSQDMFSQSFWCAIQNKFYINWFYNVFFFFSLIWKNELCHRLTLAWLLRITLITGYSQGKMTLVRPDTKLHPWSLQTRWKPCLILARFMPVSPGGGSSCEVTAGSSWIFSVGLNKFKLGENSTSHVSRTRRKPISLKDEFMFMSCHSG